jgi:hypothetical protein
MVLLARHQRARIVLALLAGIFAQMAYSESAALSQFRTFIREHPRALEELKKDPALIGKAEFAEEHKVVGDFLAQHPGVKDEVKAVPHFFDNLTATTPGGEHRNHPDGKDSKPPQNR